MGRKFIKLSESEVLWIMEVLVKYYFFSEEIRKIQRFLSEKLGGKHRS